jgi:hypothetical protein
MSAGATCCSAGPLPVYERVLGADHPDTLITRHSLARWTGLRPGPGTCSPRCPSASGSSTLNTPTPWSPSTPSPTGPGRPATRLPPATCSPALLPVREQVLAPEQADTLITHDNLARWTREAGDPARARDWYAALLPVVERVLGPSIRRP